MVLSTTNVVLDKNVSLIGGVIKNSKFVPATSTYSEVWSYPNIHGDVITTTDGAGAKQGTTRSYEPFGQKLSTEVDNLTEDFDYGWHGSDQRATEHAGGLDVVEMGARQYIPGLGRFIETDPIDGGSANAYEYSNGDPVNSSDLSGLGPNSLERAYCDKKNGVGRLIKCGIAWTASNWAQGQVEKYYPRRGDDDEVNAFRHQLWSAMLTYKLGEKDARIFLRNHEEPATADNLRDKIADVRNNETGIAIGKRGGGNRWNPTKGIVDSVRKNMRSGSYARQ